MDEHFWRLLLDLVILLGAALVLGVICERLRQSAIVGFMLAGVVVGPKGLEAVHNEAIVETIAELGVTLLMFTIGLEFSWTRLKQFGLSAAGSGAAQILITMAVASGIWFGLGYSLATSVAIGALVSLSSTEVVMPALQQRSEVDSPHGRFSLGVLLVQDAAVVPLVLLVGALGGGGTPSETLLGAAKSVLVVIGFVVVCLLTSKFALPWILRTLTGTGNREMPILIAVVSAIGAAVAAFKLGLSPALGAFIVAIFLGESVLATQLRGDIGALKTLFVTLFFASVGMFADPSWIVNHWWLVLGALAVLVVGKALIVYPIGLATGLPHRYAAASALCLAQIGVFSFVLMQVATGGAEIAHADGGLEAGGSPANQVQAPGQTQGQTHPQAEASAASAAGEGPSLIGMDLEPLLVSVIILSIFLTPYLVRVGPTSGRAWERMLRRSNIIRRTRPDSKTMAAAGALNDHVVVVGLGPAGREIGNVLKQDQTPFVVIDLNAESVVEARGRQIHALVGDAGNPALLEHLALPAARAFVVTVPDHRLSEQIIGHARAVCPGLRVIARARYSAYVDLLQSAGAEVVVDEERAVGERMKDSLRNMLKPGGVAKGEDG